MNKSSSLLSLSSSGLNDRAPAAPGGREGGPGGKMVVYTGEKEMFNTVDKHS